MISQRKVHAPCPGGNAWGRTRSDVRRLELTAWSPTYNIIIKTIIILIMLIVILIVITIIIKT